MKITITVHRSDEWTKAKRIETGENVKHDIPVEVNTEDLSQRAREILISHSGKFGDLTRLRFGRDFTMMGSGGYGWEEFTADADEFNADDISRLIVEASDRITARRLEAEEAARAAAEAEAKEKAEAEAREAELGRARELLSEEITVLENSIAKLESRLDTSRNDRRTLTSVLTAIPEGVLEGAAEVLARDLGYESTEAFKEAVDEAAAEGIFDRE